MGGWQTRTALGQIGASGDSCSPLQASPGGRHQGGLGPGLGSNPRYALAVALLRSFLLGWGCIDIGMGIGDGWGRKAWAGSPGHDKTPSASPLPGWMCKGPRMSPAAQCVQRRPSSRQVYGTVSVLGVGGVRATTGQHYYYPVVSSGLVVVMHRGAMQYSRSTIWAALRPSRPARRQTAAYGAAHRNPRCFPSTGYVGQAFCPPSPLRRAHRALMQRGSSRKQH